MKTAKCKKKEIRIVHSISLEIFLAEHPAAENTAGNVPANVLAATEFGNEIALCFFRGSVGLNDFSSEAYEVSDTELEQIQAAVSDLIVKCRRLVITHSTHDMSESGDMNILVKIQGSSENIDNRNYFCVVVKDKKVHLL